MKLPCVYVCLLVLSPVTASAQLKMNVKIDGDTSMPQVSVWEDDARLS